MTQSNRSLRNMIVMAVVAILISFAFVACGGSSPTEPGPLPTPTPTVRPPQTFVFTISATEVTPKEVTAWPGDTVVFQSTDSVNEFGIRGNSGILTSPYIPPLGSWSLVLPDFGEVRTLTFYNSLKASDVNFFGTIKLQTKY